MSAANSSMSSVAPVDERLIGEIEEFLSDLVTEMEPGPPTGTGPGRPTILPGLALWAGLLACVLRGMKAQSDIWRLLRYKGVWSFPRFFISDQAVYKRLAQAGVAPMEQFLANVTTAIGERLRPAMDTAIAPFATEVAALDCTTLDKVRRLLPSLRNVSNRDHQLLPGKLQAVFDIRRQIWRTVQFTTEVHQNEKVDARALASTLPKGSLILADLGYFSFPWFDWLTEEGYFWVSRLRQKTSYKVKHCFYAEGATFDGIVQLGAHRADRTSHAVRLVRFKVGNVNYEYITNVLDPRVMPPIDIAKLYARRWDIEMAFQLIKQHLGLHLLWASKSIVVQQQVMAVLIISQVVQALRLEIAWRAGVDPFEVSLPLLVRYLPYFAREGDDPIKVFVEQGRDLGFIRPSRRTKILAPPLPEKYDPLPTDLMLTWTSRYAHRRC